MPLPILGGALGAISPAIGPAGAATSALGTILPIAGSIIREIHAGVQRRKERLYNSPAQQVKRLREAGLPTAAGSNITGGQTQAATIGSDNYGTAQLNDNLGKSITRQIDKKRINLIGEEIRSTKANADINSGAAAWLGDQTENYLGSIQTNQAAQLDFIKASHEAEAIIKDNQQFITGIEREVKEELRDKGYLTKETIARVDQLLAATGLTNEQTSSLTDQRQARSVVLNLLRKGGMNGFEAIAYMLIAKYMGGGQ